MEAAAALACLLLEEDSVIWASLRSMALIFSSVDAFLRAPALRIENAVGRLGSCVLFRPSCWWSVLGGACVADNDNIRIVC